MRTRSLVASSAAVVVTAAGLTLAPAVPAFASTSLAVSPTTPIVGESFAATGRVSTRFKRPVVLRVYSGGAWRNARSGWTTASGTYRLPTTGISTATAYDVVARAYKRNGRTYGQSVSATRRVAPVNQTATLSVLPRVSQRGTTPASADGAVNSVVAKFSPSRPGRTVTFERTIGGSVTRFTTSERSDGTALFRAGLGGGTIRAVRAARLGAPAVATDTQADTWALAFNDEFSGSSLSPSWDYRLAGKYIASRTKSKSDASAVSVSGGTAALKVLKDPHHSGKYLNGHISTESSYHFSYGVAAARVKLQRGRGAHGGFWLQSPTYGAVPGSAAASGAEIDTVEFFGQGYPNGGLANFLYYRSSARKDVKYGGVQPTAYRLKPSSDSWWNSYHVFSVKWTPDSYTFYVDGQQLWWSNRAVSHAPEFLTLSLLSSDWELKYLDKTTSGLASKSVVRVDWARVWQR